MIIRRFNIEVKFVKILLCAIYHQKNGLKLIFATLQSLQLFPCDVLSTLIPSVLF